MGWVQGDTQLLPLALTTTAIKHMPTQQADTLTLSIMSKSGIMLLLLLLLMMMLLWLLLFLPLLAPCGWLFQIRR